MSDLVYKKKDIEVLVYAIMFNCIQTVEIKESGGSYSDNYCQLLRSERSE